MAEKLAEADRDEVIVNDVYVDPKDSSRVLLATDRGGVLYSHDGGASFDASNNGFSARQVDAFAADLTIQPRMSAWSTIRSSGECLQH